MPRRCIPLPSLAGVLEEQDHVISRRQALEHGLTVRALEWRVESGAWRKVLPNVYTASPGDLSRRQLHHAALLYAGPDAALDGVDACRSYGLREAVPDPRLVHVVVPWGQSARTTRFVVVRRSVAPLDVRGHGLMRRLAPAAAVLATARRLRRERDVLALVSAAVQQRLVTHEELVAALAQAPRQGTRLTQLALGAVAAGVHSAPENDFRVLASRSRVLPEVLFNVWVELPGGSQLCLDALVVDSALVHETNGRSAHRRLDLFEDMQVRHDLLTTAGFCVLHNSPRRLQTHGREVLAQVETCHLRFAGRGLPPGVRIIDPPAWLTRPGDAAGAPAGIPA